jgi:hypothetical protein
MSAVVVVSPEQLREVVRAAVAEVLEHHHAASTEPALLDRAGLARALGVSAPTVDRMRAEGAPELRVGDSPRFELAAVLAWLREREQRKAGADG